MLTQQRAQGSSCPGLMVWGGALSHYSRSLLLKVPINTQQSCIELRRPIQEMLD